MKTLIKVSLLLVLVVFSQSQSLAEQNTARQPEPGILHPKGLLWKIEKPGVQTSYLFGTMHVADPRVTKLADEVEQAFSGADHFVMEMLLNFSAVGYVTRSSFFSDGQTLNQLMSAQQYQRLINLLNQRLFVTEDMLQHMKPWAVLTMLMMPVEQQLSGDAALDMVLFRRATKNRKQVTGLESPEEQIAVFESLSLEEQVWMLNRSIDELKKSDAQVPRMLNAYLKADLQQLVDIQQEFMYEDSDIDDRFMYQLLEMRNHRMSERLQPILEQGSAFIAIGALHLPGEEGVLHLLEKQGYRVSVAN